MPGTIQAAEGVVDCLVEQGVNTVFTLASEEIIPLLSEIEDNRGEEIDLVECRHEQGAAAMADGYARARDDVGVCIVGFRRIFGARVNSTVEKAVNSISQITVPFLS